MKRDTGWVALGVLVALIAVNALVLHKEWILHFGRPLLLELAPVDPRSIIQGDYMRLEYRVTRDAGPARKEAGTLLLSVDPGGVGRYLAQDAAPAGPEQLVLAYRRGRGGRVQAGAGPSSFRKASRRPTPRRSTASSGSDLAARRCWSACETEPRLTVRQSPTRRSPARGP